MFRSRMVYAVAIAVIAGSVVAMIARASTAPERRPMRFGSVIGVRAEKLEEYKKLHAAVWPAVVDAMRAAHIRTYSIYLRKLPDGKHYLFSYMEYVGDDFDGDMKRMAADPESQRWWKLTDPCQEPLPDRAAGQWWAPMEEVCHVE